MAEKAGYKHFMLKEIFEQPTAARETILGRVSQDSGKVFLEEMKIDRRAARGRRARHDPRVRHVVARRPGRQVHDRAARAAPGRSRLRLRVPLSRSDRHAEHAGGRHHAVGRDGRHARGAARGEARRRAAASPSATSSAAWRRARPTARSTRTPARRSASPRPRRSRRSSSRCTCSRCGSAQVRGALSLEASKPHVDALLQLPLLLEQTLKVAPEIEEIAGALPQPHRLPLSRPRHQLSDRARGRAQAEGNLLHPRRGLPGRRDEARPDRAHRRADAGRRRIAPHDHVFEKMIGNMQEVKARGGSVIALTTRGDDKLAVDPRPAQRRRHRGAADARAADADRRWCCRCSCSPTTSPSAAAATSISRGTWRRASRSSRDRSAGGSSVGWKRRC